MALSQMMRHYLEMKDKYKGCILFYRLGDFYEMFFEDAEKVSKLLDLTLTGKDCGLEERAPMCGIPYHAADVYISKLVALGEKVAICEQLSDPKESRGLVDRDVVRVVSAGTLIDDTMLDETKNNYIASLFKSGDTVAVAWDGHHDGRICRDGVLRRFRGRGHDQSAGEIVRGGGHLQRGYADRVQGSERNQAQSSACHFPVTFPGRSTSSTRRKTFSNSSKRFLSRRTESRARKTPSPRRAP